MTAERGAEAAETAGVRRGLRGWGPFALTVKGVRGEAYAEPRRTLADFLREDLGLTGTHVGCEHGVCGACTVLVNGEAVRACLMLAIQARGAEVLTVEGLARDGKLHPIQEAFWEAGSFQCGFCTPGFVLSTYAFLRDHPDPDERAIREALSGNLCRCSGYQSIVEGVRLAAQKLTATAAAVTAAVQKTGTAPSAAAETAPAERGATRP
ncbi:MAG: (2Fe-2S)-binding protein [Clostridia bacterium]|nr:(2Fe-2S)-binding protein [Clostridia bacterium]